MLQSDEFGTKRARKLRREMTLPEVMLWQNLRGNPNGLKFRKQHPSGPYVADFYCHKARMIVEVDGVSHDMGNVAAKDEKRDAWFAARNLEVVRIAATEILTDVSAISQSIVDHATAKLAKEK